MKLRTAILVYGVPLTILAVSLRHGGSKPGASASLSMAHALAPATSEGAATVGGITARLERELHPRGDAWLAGEIDLAKVRLVTAQNRYEAPMSGGRTAILTLDPKVQQRADAVIADANAPYAAIVVMSTDGRLLAVAARSQTEPGKSVEELALRPWAPAASVFKIVTSAALVAAGVSPDAEDVCYHGGVHAIDATNLTDQSYDATCNSLAFGVAESQNAILAKLAVKHLTVAKLRAEAMLFGLGQTPAFALGAAPSKIDLADSAPPLELGRAAAGFWHSQLSTLDGALLAETIASGGMQVVPRIVAGVLDPDGSVTPIRPIAPVRAIDEKVAGAVAKMLIGVTEHGTAYKAFHDSKGRRLLGDAVIAGKTGSLSGPLGSVQSDDGTPAADQLGYSWFVGYGPVSKPSIVVAVLLGNSATWKMKAHVAARRVLEAAFQK